jgi:hypothetical protein
MVARVVGWRGGGGSEAERDKGKQLVFLQRCDARLKRGSYSVAGKRFFTCHLQRHVATHRKSKNENFQGSLQFSAGCITDAAADDVVDGGS